MQQAGLRSLTVPQKRLRAAHLLFLLFWVLKPFYFGESGSMQISDFVFIASFFVWVFQRGGRISIDRRDLAFVGFTGFVFLINGVYFLLFSNTEFLLKSFYFIYNLLVIIIIRDLMNNRTFLKALLWASFFNLLVQLAVLLSGGGSFFVSDLRFMGTFNDPNQYSFSMFTSFLMVYLLSQHFQLQGDKASKIIQLASFVLAGYFIFQGSSTGMLLGIGSFSATWILVSLFRKNTPGYVLLRILVITLAVILVAVLLSSMLFSTGLGVADDADNFLLLRLNEKIDKFDDKGLIALVEERGIDKVVNHPVYLLYGSGEGYYERFPESPFEVHSTFIAILFAYGIIPFLTLIKWIRVNLKGIHIMVIPVFLALFFESFTLAHQRQPVFWMLIIMASLALKPAQKATATPNLSEENCISK